MAQSADAGKYLFDKRYHSPKEALWWSTKLWKPCLASPLHLKKGSRTGHNRQKKSVLAMKLAGPIVAVWDNIFKIIVILTSRQTHWVRLDLRSMPGEHTDRIFLCDWILEKKKIIHFTLILHKTQKMSLSLEIYWENKIGQWEISFGLRAVNNGTPKMVLQKWIPNNKHQLFNSKLFVK